MAGCCDPCGLDDEGSGSGMSSPDSVLGWCTRTPVGLGRGDSTSASLAAAHIAPAHLKNKVVVRLVNVGQRAYRGQIVSSPNVRLGLVVWHRLWGTISLL